MPKQLTVYRASVAEAQPVAVMVGELLQEIMTETGLQAFVFNLDETVLRLQQALAIERYVVFVANAEHGEPVGFIAMYESFSLYAGGAFGTLPEFYVRRAFRSRNIGRQLLEQAQAFARSRAWTRLEVTTPPLPQFDRTLAFYTREGFTIAGGRKLKLSFGSAGE